MILAKGPKSLCITDLVRQIKSIDHVLSIRYIGSNNKYLPRYKFFRKVQMYKMVTAVYMFLHVQDFGMASDLIKFALKKDPEPAREIELRQLLSDIYNFPRTMSALVEQGRNVEQRHNRQ